MRDLYLGYSSEYNEMNLEQRAKKETARFGSDIHKRALLQICFDTNETIALRFEV